MKTKSKSTKNFAEKVREIVRKIPSGRPLSYAEVARRAGSSLAARAVGNILRKNRDPQIPCHRVIRSDGSLGGYNRGMARKAKILLAEKTALQSGNKSGKI